MPSLENTAKIVAYQKSHLLNIRQLYERLHIDLNDYLTAEQQMAGQIRALEQGLCEICPETIDSKKITDDHAASRLKSIILPSKRYPLCEVAFTKTLDELVVQAEDYLRQHNVDLTQDPLLQVLSTQEILDIAESYRKKYGVIGWEREDYVIVSLAGFIGTLLDLLLVKIPENSKFLLELPQGYALATWIRKHAARLQEEYLTPLRALAETHKEQNRETGDTLLAFVSAVLDIIRYTGTYMDDHGNIILSKRLSSESEEGITTTFTKALLDLLAKVFPTVGLQPPSEHLFRQETVPWQEIVRYLHEHGYNIKDFLVMGIVPATVELIVKGYWLLNHFEAQENLDRLTVKFTSMLLLSHTIAVSGHFIKTGLLFQVNPLTLNWEHILRCVPLLVSWVNQGIERENQIRAALDDEWMHLYEHGS